MSQRSTRFGLALVALFACQCALAMDFNGYVRGLAGINSENSGAACYKLAGAESKFRLGNECEVYSELILGQEFYQAGNGVSVSGHGMLSIYAPTAGDVSMADEKSDIALPQAYLQVKNLPQLSGAALWAGRRYYKREDVHMTDFFYWNPSGLGLGIEDFKLGDLKLSYAFLRNDNSSFRYPDSQPEESANRHDMQVRGIPLNPQGELEVGLSLVSEHSRHSDAHDGWSTTVQHHQKGILEDGWNKLAFQYGSGPGAGLGTTGSLTNDSDTRRYRVVESLYGRLSPHLSGMMTAVYQLDRAHGDTQTWTSLGGRVAYDLREHLKINVEIGADHVNPEHGEARHLTKFTIAPTLTAGPGFWARPELRLFYTYAHWNDAAREAAAGAGDAAVAVTSTTGVFGNENSGSTLGLQLETWW